jgi:hypothetical protein
MTGMDMDDDPYDWRCQPPEEWQEATAE